MKEKTRNLSQTFLTIVIFFLLFILLFFTIVQFSACYQKDSFILDFKNLFYCVDLILFFTKCFLIVYLAILFLLKRLKILYEKGINYLIFALILLLIYLFYC